MGFAGQLRAGGGARASGHRCHPAIRARATRVPARHGCRLDAGTCACVCSTHGPCSDHQGARTQRRARRTQKKKYPALAPDVPGSRTVLRGVPTPPASTRSPAQGATPGGCPPAGRAPQGSTRSNLLRFLILGRGWRGPGSEPLRVLAPAALRAALPPPPAPPPGRDAGCRVLGARCPLGPR